MRRADPGTRAPRSSALLRAEFAAIEDGFDKLPDVGTANLFSVSDGSALVGKTASRSFSGQKKAAHQVSAAKRARAYSLLFR